MMGHLYPRLLPIYARLIHDELDQIPTAELTSRSALEHETAVYTAIGGDRIAKTALADLRTSLISAAQDAGFPDPPSVQNRIAFDNRIGPMLHREMGIVAAEAASGDVWAFLALVLAPDVGYWRFRRSGERFNPEHVLGNDLTRHTFARLWWRAYLLANPDAPDDQDSFAAIGEAAFDQILSRRRALGASPSLVQGILRVWRRVEPGETVDRGLLQDFLIRLLRLAPFIAFESLSSDQLDAELLIVAKESVEALGRAHHVD